MIKYQLDYIYTTRHLTDYYQSFLRTFNRVLYLAVGLAVYINIVLVALSALVGYTLFDMTVTNISTGVVLGTLLVVGNGFNIIHWWSCVKKKPQQSQKIQYIFTESGIDVITETKSRVKYDDIKAQIYSKKYIFLVHENNTPIIVPQTALSEGDFTALMAWLKTRLSKDGEVMPFDPQIAKKAAIVVAVILLILPIFWGAILLR